MGRYLVKRLMLMIPVLFVISLVNFALYSFAPGDPVTLMMNRSWVRPEPGSA